MADDRFYVKTLRMQNFRCFEDVELGPFDPHFNLLVGENGAGKSSVLVALADLFRQFGKPELNAPGAKLIGRNDVRLEHWTGVDKVTTLKLHLPGGISAKAVAGADELEAYELVSDPEPFSVTLTPEIVKPMGGLLRFRPGMNTRGQISDAPLRLISMYAASRGTNIQVPNKTNLSENRLDRLQGLENWDNAGTNSTALREWIKDQTAAALQHYQREIASGKSSEATRFNQIALIVNSVAQAVEGISNFEYDYDRQDIVIEWNSGQRTDFSNMSDGQRMMIGLFADIARRACQLNGAFLGAKTLEETSGLVLIDEIDLHLHPKWQRQIVPALKKIFPKIQFFATTHSPQVIGEAKPEEIIVLTPQGQKRPSGGYGRDSNWILECVMDAEGRDPEIALRLKEMFNLIEDEKFNEARVAIKALRQDIGYGPDVVSAEAYLWRMEHLGEEAAE